MLFVMYIHKTDSNCLCSVHVINVDIAVLKRRVMKYCLENNVKESGMCFNDGVFLKHICEVTLLSSL